MKQTDVVPLRKVGRCSTGAERDGGTIYHGVLKDGNPWSKALCGTAPGKRGNGWSTYPGDKVTCLKCLKRIDHQHEPEQGMPPNNSHPMTNAEKQAAMREREKARGIIRVLVKIPAERKAELDEIVRRWMADKGEDR